MSALIRKSVLAMQGYVPGEQPQDTEIIKLNTNENPYLPSPEVYDILREIDVATLARYPDPRCFELRKVIADLHGCCLLYTSPSPRDRTRSRMPSSA